jgi:hypothetical protein
MEEIKVVNKKRWLVTTIISGILMLASIICCIMWAYMINEHFELQATAEDFEGLASIGIIIVGLIFAAASIISLVISTIISIVTIIKSKKLFKILNIVFIAINVAILIIDVVLFFVLKG